MVNLWPSAFLLVSNFHIYNTGTLFTLSLCDYLSRGAVSTQTDVQAHVWWQLVRFALAGVTRSYGRWWKTSVHLSYPHTERGKSKTAWSLMININCDRRFLCSAGRKTPRHHGKLKQAQKDGRFLSAAPSRLENVCVNKQKCLQTSSRNHTWTKGPRWEPTQEPFNVAPMLTAASAWPAKPHLESGLVPTSRDGLD